MLTQALLIAVATYFIKFFALSWGNFQMRPIIIGPIIGLILGDFQQGIIMGASLEAVFLGVFGVGGSLPSDTEMGAIIGTSFAILLKENVETAVALAVPVGLIAVFVYQLIKIVWHNAVVAIADRSIKNKNDRGFERIHIVAMIAFGLPYAVISFVAIMVGVEPISHLMENLPQVINDFLTIASRLLPALGFAMLLRALWDYELVPFFFIGFGMAAYLGLDTMGIALFGIVIAFLYGINYMKKTKVTQKTATLANQEASGDTDVDDFFE